MTARSSRPTVFVLVAVLLSSLACSLFRSEPPRQPATATPVIPATRPADFTVTYDWREGSLPPPYHYEYNIAVAADGTVTLTYRPGYANDTVPVWTETVSLDAAEMDTLYAVLAADGLFTTHWQAQDDTPVGGSSEWVTASVNGATIEVPAYVIPEQAVDAGALAALLKGLIPSAIWDDLNAQREQYVAEHSE